MTESTTPPPAPEVVSLSEEQYYTEYSPIAAPDGSDTWEFEQIKDKPTEFVWSVVETGDADHDALYAIPGWHVVNVLGYNLTTKAWPHENIEALIHEFTNDDNDDTDSEDNA
jgi:hypothetical protein